MDRKPVSPTAAPRQSAAAPVAPAVGLSSDPHSICPGCGAPLVDRGCKMRCLRCGFFLDCSDG